MTKPNNDKNNSSQKKAEPILTLVDDPKGHKLTKDNSVTWDVRVTPNSDTSPTFKLTVRILSGDEEIRQLIRWFSDVKKVVRGINATTFAEARPIYEALMRETPKGVFNRELELTAILEKNNALEVAVATDAASGTANDTREQDIVNGRAAAHYLELAHLATAGQALIAHLCPRQALAKVKKALRRDMRKPPDMKVRTYYQHLVRINREELAALPPLFNNTQSLLDSEMVDIILYGTPRSWQNEMDRMGFDPFDKTLGQLIGFMENIEAAEARQAKTDSGKKTDKSAKKPKKESSGTVAKPKYFCTHHGENWTHDTKDCRVIQNGKSHKSDGNRHGNKTWSRKSDEAKKASRKELAAMINKTVEKKVKKQLASIDKKRKSDDSDSDGECHLLDALVDGKLDGFNYEDMENLKLDDDEFSV